MQTTSAASGSSSASWISPASKAANPLLVDLRNIYRADEVARYGFAYEGVGRRGK